MRVALVVLAALVVAPAASAHAKVSPTVIREHRTTTLTLHVPTESATAATVRVAVTAPPSFRIAGTTSWHGRTRGDVTLSFRARADKPGDYALDVRQTYSDGTVVAWAGPESSNTPAPVVHVQGVENENRDRLLIALAVAVVLVALLALRGRRERPQ